MLQTWDRIMIASKPTGHDQWFTLPMAMLKVNTALQKVKDASGKEWPLIVKESPQTFEQARNNEATFNDDKTECVGLTSMFDQFLEGQGDNLEADKNILADRNGNNTHANDFGEYGKYWALKVK